MATAEHTPRMLTGACVAVGAVAAGYLIYTRLICRRKEGSNLALQTAGTVRNLKAQGGEIEIGLPTDVRHNVHVGLDTSEGSMKRLPTKFDNMGKNDKGKWMPRFKRFKKVTKDDNLEFKIVLLGEEAVGKSAITKQFMVSYFPEEHDPTIEDIYRKQIRRDPNMLIFDLVDTGGDISTYDSNSIVGGDGFLIVFSINDKKSFTQVPEWYKRIHDLQPPEDVAIVLVGNKSDLEAERQVTAKEGHQMAKAVRGTYIEVSALDMVNVEEAFQLIIDQITAASLDEGGHSVPAPAPLVKDVSTKELKAGGGLRFIGKMPWMKPKGKPIKESDDSSRNTDSRATSVRHEGNTPRSTRPEDRGKMKKEFSLVMFGMEQVGKSSVVQQFIQHKVPEEHDHTIHDSYRKQVKIHGTSVQLYVEDLGAGEELPDSVDVDGVVLVYSVLDKNTIDQVPMLLEEAVKSNTKFNSVPLILVGNKSDLAESERAVHPAYGVALAQKLQCSFLEINAHDAAAVEEVFVQLVNSIIDAGGA